MNKNEGKTKGGRKQLAHKVSKAFEITVKTAHNVVKLVQNCNKDSESGVVSTGVKTVTLPANPVTVVYMRARVRQQVKGQDMLFSPDAPDLPPEGIIYNEALVRITDRRVPYVLIPVTNTTDHTIYLKSRKVVGHLEPVKTVYSADIKTKVNELTKEAKSGTGLKTNKPSQTELSESEHTQRPR